MPLEEFVRVSAQSLELVLWVSAPVLGAALVLGALIAAASSATGLQEPSLSYVPKLVGVSLVLVFFGAWMAGHVVAFTQGLWTEIPTMVERSPVD